LVAAPNRENLHIKSTGFGAWQVKVAGRLCLPRSTLVISWFDSASLWVSIRIAFWWIWFTFWADAVKVSSKNIGKKQLFHILKVMKF
jgi:hypothetical protein